MTVIIVDCAKKVSVDACRDSEEIHVRKKLAEIHVLIMGYVKMDYVNVNQVTLEKIVQFPSVRIIAQITEIA